LYNYLIGASKGGAQMPLYPTGGGGGIYSGTFKKGRPPRFPSDLFPSLRTLGSKLRIN